MDPVSQVGSGDGDGGKRTWWMGTPGAVDGRPGPEIAGGGGGCCCGSGMMDATEVAGGGGCHGSCCGPVMVVTGVGGCSP